MKRLYARGLCPGLGWSADEQVDTQHVLVTATAVSCLLTHGTWPCIHQCNQSALSRIPRFPVSSLLVCRQWELLPYPAAYLCIDNCTGTQPRINAIPKSTP